LHAFFTPGTAGPPYPRQVWDGRRTEISRSGRFVPKKQPALGCPDNVGGLAYRLRQRFPPCRAQTSVNCFRQSAGAFVWLLTGRGFCFICCRQPKESIGNAFRDACRTAGINKSAHGLRKAAATRAANNGATVAELEAIFGWEGGRMASLYTRSADRERLATRAMEKLSRTSIPSPDGEVRELIEA